MILEQADQHIQYDFQLFMFKFSLASTDFVQLFNDPPKFFLLIFDFRQQLTFFNPLFPVSILEILNLHIGFTNILGSLPEPEVAFFSPAS